MVLLELAWFDLTESAPGPGRQTRTPETGSHLAVCRDRTEGLVCRDGGEDLLVVPVLLDLTLGLDLGEIGVVKDSVVCSPHRAVAQEDLSLIHISEPTRRTPISYAVFCLKKKKK